jgi:hypothetical protein
LDAGHVDDAKFILGFGWSACPTQSGDRGDDLAELRGGLGRALGARLGGGNVLSTCTASTTTVVPPSSGGMPIVDP